MKLLSVNNATFLWQQTEKMLLKIFIHLRQKQNTTRRPCFNILYICTLESNDPEDWLLWDFSIDQVHIYSVWWCQVSFDILSQLSFQSGKETDDDDRDQESARVMGVSAAIKPV